jgi:hypothetical protein
MKLFYYTAWIAVISIVLSCNAQQNDKAPQNQISELKAVELNGPGMTGDKEFLADTTVGQVSGNGTKQKQSQTPSPINPDWDKKIVKTANLNAEVKDYKSFYSSIREKVRSAGGYIAQEEQNQSEYKIENSLVIKVPVDQFDNALFQLTSNTERINEKKITSSDVTAEVIDTKSRMESKKQVRLRYLDLLKQAKNMEEILNVQHEINGIQEQIESATGRIEYLSHSSAFSTINMTYYQVLNITAKDKENPSFGTELTSAFRAGWDWIGILLVGIVSIWPLLILVGLVVVMYRKTKVRKPKQA